MSGQIKTCRLLLHDHLFHRGILLNVRYRYDCRAFGAVLAEIPEEVHLPGDVVPLGLRDAVYDRAGDLHERSALIAHGVKGAGFDEVFDRAAVEIAAVGTLAEIFKAPEHAAALALGHEAFYRAPAHALDGYKAVADVAAADREVRAGLVDVRRQQLYPEIAAFGDVLGDLRAVFEHGGQQRRHVFGGVVPLHVSCAVSDDSVAYRVRFVESVACEVEYFVVYAVGGLLADAVGDGAGNAAARVAVDESHALGVDDLVLFFAHCPADHVRLTERKAAELAENFYDLFLINYAAVGYFKYRAQQLVLVADLLRVRRALDKARDAVHRPRAVKGNDSGDILDALRLEPRTDAGHARAFELKHAAGASGGEHIERRPVILGSVFYAEIRHAFLHQPDRVVENSEVSQPEKVHLQQTQLFKRRHLVLADDGLVVLCQRDVFVYRLFGDNDAGGMGRGMARHTLQSLRHVDEPPESVVALVHLAQRL